ncbi:MAG: hypothetical protein EOO38_27945 [Cytophagaceae bacterium]|nr:MAG: hypothetical protein EOO38_27945 [Cytophagaceae bacterium]
MVSYVYALLQGSRVDVIEMLLLPVLYAVSNLNLARSGDYGYQNCGKEDWPKEGDFKNRKLAAIRAGKT